MQAVKWVKFQPLDELSDETQQGNTYNDLKKGRLLSVGQLSDDNCMYIFSRHHINVFKNGKVIIKGRCNPMNVLYNTLIAPTDEPSIRLSSQQQALLVIQDSKTRKKLAGYFHTFMYIPTPVTLLRAFKKGHFRSWTVLTVSLIYKHLAKSIATILGHLCHQ